MNLNILLQVRSLVTGCITSHNTVQGTGSSDCKHALICGIAWEWECKIQLDLCIKVCIKVCMEIIVQHTGHVMLW